VEDAYVMRGVAEWHQPEPKILPPKDKMIHGDSKLPISKK
jgi:hypothetical protein